jgi:hypothetical protein
MTYAVVAVAHSNTFACKPKFQQNPEFRTENLPNMKHKRKPLHLKWLFWSYAAFIHFSKKTVNIREVDGHVENICAFMSSEKNATIWNTPNKFQEHESAIRKSPSGHADSSTIALFHYSTKCTISSPPM